MVPEPGSGPAPQNAALGALLRQGRSALLRGLILEIFVTLAIVACAVLLIGAIGVAAGASNTAVALLEALATALALGAIAFVYGRRVSRGLRSDAAVAGWMDGVLIRRGSVNAEAGRLRAAVELLRDRGQYGESAALADAAVERATQEASRARAAELTRQEVSGRLRPRLWGLAGSTAVLVALAIFGAQLLQNAAMALFSMDRIEDVLRRVPPEPRLGDLELTFRYPAYSERPNRTITSPSGHIRALPGTEVTIETTSRHEVARATLLITHGDNVEAEPEKMAVEARGRHLETTMVIARSGRYRFHIVTTDGDVLEERRGHEIELELDQPPEVTLLEPTESPLEVNENDRITVVFRATDDFALGEASLSWRVLGSAREGSVRLTSAPTGQRRFSGSAQVDLAELKLTPGDRVAYSVQVRDNDTVNGPKVGASETKELRIYSKKAHHDSVLAMQEQALTELVHILGDNLEGLFDKVADLDRYRALLESSAKIVERAMTADDLLVKTVAAIRKDPLGRAQVAEAFEQARRELSRTTTEKRRAVTTARRAVEKATAVDALRIKGVRRSQDRMVSSLEKNVVYLADLLNDQRMVDAEALAKELRAKQQALRAALEDLKNAPTEEKRQALTQAIQEIRKQIDEIAKELSKLQASIPMDYVDPDAMAAQETEAGMDEVEKMLENGDLDGAMEALDQMLKRTEQMMSELQSGRTELETREYSEITKQAQEIWDELEKLEKDQRDLANRTEKASKEVLDRMKSRLGDADSFIEKQRKRLAEAQRTLENVRPDSHMPEADLFERSERRLADAQRALEAKDFGAAKEVLEQATDQLRQLEQEARRRSENARRYGVFGMGESAERTERAMRKARPQVESVLQDIEALTPPPASLLSAEEKKQLERYGQRQEELERRAGQLGKELESLGEKLPIVGPKVGQMVQEARQSMGEAQGSLGGGDAPGALGQERTALDKLGQLKSELEQMGQNQGGGQGGGVPLPFGQQPQGEGSQGGYDGRDPRNMEKVEIPQPDQHRAPVEFREDILEAAKQGTAEQYRDAVRRYYEELVK